MIRQSSPVNDTRFLVNGSSLDIQDHRGGRVLPLGQGVSQRFLANRLQVSFQGKRRSAFDPQQQHLVVVPAPAAGLPSGGQQKAYWGMPPTSSFHLSWVITTARS